MVLPFAYEITGTVNGPYNQVSGDICIIHQKYIIFFSPLQPNVAVM
jgi:hypothetical protein